mgnify:CR=1 FL=1
MNQNKNIFNLVLKAKKLGKWKFILIYGLIIYGLVLFLVYQLTLLIISLNTIKDLTFETYLTDSNNQIRFLSSFILFELMGIYIAKNQWKNYKKKNLI